MALVDTGQKRTIYCQFFCHESRFSLAYFNLVSIQVKTLIRDSKIDSILYVFGQPPPVHAICSRHFKFVPVHNIPDTFFLSARKPCIPNRPSACSHIKCLFWHNFCVGVPLCRSDIERGTFCIG